MNNYIFPIVDSDSTVSFGNLRFFGTGALMLPNSDTNPQPQCIDSSNVRWKTRDGVIVFEIVDTSQTTEPFDYYFNNVEYNYSVNINTESLILENDVSRIRLNRWFKSKLLILRVDRQGFSCSSLFIR